MKTLLLSGLFLLCCAAAADCAVAEAVTELDDLPERAVFEVDRQYTLGLGGGAQWKVLASKVMGGRYGKRVGSILEGGLPAFVFYDVKGNEVAREEVNGMSSADIDAMLLKYGFFPGDTREPAAEAATPPSLAKPASGGGCGARKRTKEQAVATAAAQAEGQHTATHLAEAAAAAATAAAKAATAAAAAAEAAVAALAAVQGGSCTA